MNIREATKEDWRQIRDLYLTLLGTDPNAFIDQYDDIATRTEDQWIKGLEDLNTKTFIATSNDRFIGMGRITFYKEIPNVPVLHKLGVLPDYRGQGLAKKLVKVREEWAVKQNARKVRLYVISDREKTIEFSKKNGYTITDILRDHSQRKDGIFVDVVVMEKELK